MIQMIKHIVILGFKEQYRTTDKETHLQFCKSRLESLNGTIDGLIKLEVGFDFSDTTASGDLAIYSEFVSRQALDRYYSNENHLAVKAPVDELMQNRIVIDYEIQ